MKDHLISTIRLSHKNRLFVHRPLPSGRSSVVPGFHTTTTFSLLEKKRNLPERTSKLLLQSRCRTWDCDGAPEVSPKMASCSVQFKKMAETAWRANSGQVSCTSRRETPHNTRREEQHCGKFRHGDAGAATVACVVSHRVQHIRGDKFPWARARASRVRLQAKVRLLKVLETPRAGMEGARSALTPGLCSNCARTEDFWSDRCLNRSIALLRPNTLTHELTRVLRTIEVTVRVARFRSHKVGYPSRPQHGDNISSLLTEFGRVVTAASRWSRQFTIWSWIMSTRRT